MPIYFGNNNITDLRFGSHTIGEVYYGNILVYSRFKNVVMTTPGVKVITLPKGKYQVLIRAAGGAGGQGGRTVSADLPGRGGAGGEGDIVYRVITIDRPTEVEVYLGQAGKIDGNGGTATPADQQYQQLFGGKGGGGAFPSYVRSTDGSLFIYALGGGGGGGGGGASYYGRYSPGAPGGGGGGFYRLSQTGVITSIQGKDALRGGIGRGARSPGFAGIAGNTEDFPNLWSGYGGQGGKYHHDGYLGGDGAQGGGASGGSGASGEGNHSSSHGGGGGGGAGGDYNAGGGEAGAGRGPRQAINASNFHQEPNDTTAENLEYGLVGDYGTGGRGGDRNWGWGSNGKNGYISITRVPIPPVESWDLYFIDEQIAERVDCGSTTETVTETKDMGVI